MRHGVVRRDDIPLEIGDDVDKLLQVSAAAVDALATLHAVDWQAVGLEAFGCPAGYLGTAVVSLGRLAALAVEAVQDLAIAGG